MSEQMRRCDTNPHYFSCCMAEKKPPDKYINKRKAQTDNQAARRGATEEMKSRGAFISPDLTRTCLRAQVARRQPASQTAKTAPVRAPRASPSAARQVADSPSAVGPPPPSPRCCGELSLPPFQPLLPLPVTFSSHTHSGFTHPGFTHPGFTRTRCRRLRISGSSRRWCEFLKRRRQSLIWSVRLPRIASLGH